MRSGLQLPGGPGRLADRRDGHGARRQHGIAVIGPGHHPFPGPLVHRLAAQRQVARETRRTHRQPVKSQPVKSQPVKSQPVKSQPVICRPDSGRPDGG